jgi:hypothetical protein
MNGWIWERPGVPQINPSLGRPDRRPRIRPAELFLHRLPARRKRYFHRTASVDPPELFQFSRAGAECDFCRGRNSAPLPHASLAIGFFDADAGPGLLYPGVADIRRQVEMCAKCQKKSSFHSITSSARVSIEGGTVMPSALAVLTLIAISNLVGACTGKSAGFAPFRMRSM